MAEQHLPQFPTHCPHELVLTRCWLLRQTLQIRASEQADWTVACNTGRLSRTHWASASSSERNLSVMSSPHRASPAQPATRCLSTKQFWPNTQAVVVRSSSAHITDYKIAEHITRLINLITRQNQVDLEQHFLSQQPLLEASQITFLSSQQML